jgi:hypothetical protein
MEKTRKIIIRVHVVMIMLMGLAACAASSIGRFTGQGDFAWLAENHFAYGGLIQAYFLMAVLGLSIWFGTTNRVPARWHLIGALAHVMPLAANFMMFPYAGEVNFENYSRIATTIHALWIVIELGLAAYAAWAARLVQKAA